MTNILKTSGIVLSLRDYSETTQIATIFTKSEGKLQLISRGSKKVSKKKFPILGLFRVVEFNCKQKSHNTSNLLSMQNPALLTEHDALASDYSSYELACKLAEFIIKNCEENDPVVHLYNVFVKILEELSQKHYHKHRWQATLILSYILEQGLIPGDMQINNKQEDILAQFSPFANNANLDFNDPTWEKLFHWSLQMAHYLDLKID